METFVTAATQVLPSEIHATLSRLWEAFERSGKMRASLFNLILYAEEGPRSNYFHTVAQTIINKFPARIIFIEKSAKPNENPLTTKVSILSATGQKQEAACDLIEINASENQEARVPFILLPHILPDLPIYCLWGEEPNASDQLFLELSKLATRLIFDSESSSSLPKFAKTLLDLHNSKGVDIADLNWARTENWRNTLSSTFYKAEKLIDLSLAKEIKISYNKAPTSAFCHTNIQALYIQNWLAAQLGWKLQKAQKGLSFLYAKEKSPVTITLFPQDQKTHAPGMILSIEIFSEEEKHYSFILSGPAKITLTFSTRDLCELPTQFLSARGEKGHSLVKEVCLTGTSSHYLKVLERLSTLDESLLC